MTQGPGPTQQWSGEPKAPYGGDGKRSTFRRYLWPILAGDFALVSFLLAGVIIGSRNNTAEPPPAAPNVQATAAPTTSTTPSPTTATSTTALPTTTSSAISPPATAAPTTSTAPKQRTVMYDCTRQSVETPASFVLACGDANTTLTHLQWSGWGQTTAHATGALAENNCAPNCAQGRDVQYPASVTVSTIAGGHYTYMHVSAPQAPGYRSDYALTPLGPG